MQRFEFVQFARQPHPNIRELSRRFSISPSTAYKWLERFDDTAGKDHALRRRSNNRSDQP